MARALLGHKHHTDTLERFYLNNLAQKDLTRAALDGEDVDMVGQSRFDAPAIHRYRLP